MFVPHHSVSLRRMHIAIVHLHLRLGIAYFLSLGKVSACASASHHVEDLVNFGCSCSVKDLVWKV